MDNWNSNFWRLWCREQVTYLSWIQKKCFPILANMYISLKLEDLWVHEKKFHHYSNGVIHITYHQYTKNGILLPKLFWPTLRKNYFGDQEKLLKFEGEGQEFVKCLKSIEQFIRTVKGKINFWNKMLFNLFSEVSQI